MLISVLVDMSFLQESGNFTLMLVLEETLGANQSQQDSSFGDHKCQHKVSYWSVKRTRLNISHADIWGDVLDPEPAGLRF